MNVIDRARFLMFGDAGKETLEKERDDTAKEKASVIVPAKYSAKQRPKWMKDRKKEK